MRLCSSFVSACVRPRRRCAGTRYLRQLCQRTGHLVNTSKQRKLSTALTSRSSYDLKPRIANPSTMSSSTSGSLDFFLRFGGRWGFSRTGDSSSALSPSFALLSLWACMRWALFRLRFRCFTSLSIAMPQTLKTLWSVFHNSPCPLSRVSPGEIVTFRMAEQARLPHCKENGRQSIRLSSCGPFTSFPGHSATHSTHTEHLLDLPLAPNTIIIIFTSSESHTLPVNTM